MTTDLLRVRAQLTQTQADIEFYADAYPDGYGDVAVAAANTAQKDAQRALALVEQHPTDGECWSRLDAVLGRLQDALDQLYVEWSAAQDFS